MKRRILCAIAALLMALTLTVPGYAANEYGVYYDETEMLYSELLETMGSQTLPGLTGAYNIDLRVDVLTSIGEFSEVTESATYIYEQFEYGADCDGDCLSLTLLVHEDDTGVALDQYCLLAFSGVESQSAQDCRDFVDDRISPLFTQQMWSGDLASDITVMENAIAGMVGGFADFMAMPEETTTAAAETTTTTAAETTTTTAAETTTTTAAETTTAAAETTTTAPAVNEDLLVLVQDHAQALATPAATESKLDAVTDQAGILTTAEWEALEQKARTLADKHDLGFYIVTVPDYREYAGGGDVFDAAYNIYHDNLLGRGEDRDGVMLLLSMKDRDFNLFTNGGRGQYAFNDSGRPLMVPFFTDDFKEDRWYDGLNDYLTWSDRYMEAASAGTPYSSSNEPMSDSDRTFWIAVLIAVMVVVPLLAGFGTLLVLKLKMGTVKKATEASAYVTGELELSERSDLFTHSTETRRRIEKEDNDTTNRSSGSSSGTSGKF